MDVALRLLSQLRAAMPLYCAHNLVQNFSPAAHWRSVTVRSAPRCAVQLKGITLEFVATSPSGLAYFVVGVLSASGTVVKTSPEPGADACMATEFCHSGSHEIRLEHDYNFLRKSDNSGTPVAAPPKDRLANMRWKTTGKRRYANSVLLAAVGDVGFKSVTRSP